MSGIFKIGTPSTQVNQYMRLVGPNVLSDNPQYAGIITFSNNKLKVSFEESKTNILWKDIATEDSIENLNGVKFVTTQVMNDYTKARYEITHNLNTRDIIVNLYINRIPHGELLHKVAVSSANAVIVDFTQNILAGAVLIISPVPAGTATWTQSLEPESGGGDSSTVTEHGTGGSGNDSSTISGSDSSSGTAVKPEGEDTDTSTGGNDSSIGTSEGSGNESDEGTETGGGDTGGNDEINKPE